MWDVKRPVPGSRCGRGGKSVWKGQLEREPAGACALAEEARAAAVAAAAAEAAVAEAAAARAAASAVAEAAAATAAEAQAATVGRLLKALPA